MSRGKKEGERSRVKTVKEDIEQTGRSFEKVLSKLHSRPSNVGDARFHAGIIEVAGPP